MPFRPPSFRTIAAFEAAARYENFARAAAELNLTQSAVSHAIRNLEARLGAPLFHRHGRRVSLTAEGGRLAKRVRASLSLLAEAFGDAWPGDETRRLVIGAPSEFAARVLLPKLASGRMLDGCDVRTNTPVAALTEGTADLIVVRGYGKWPALASRALGRDTLLPVASPALAMRDGFPVLARLPLIENAQHPWRLWFAQVPGAGEPSDCGLVVDGWGLAIDAAAAGAGVCLAPLSLVQEDLASGRLIRLGRSEATLEEGYHLLWNPQAAQQAPIRALVEWLSRELSRSSRDDAVEEGAPRRGEAALSVVQGAA